MSDQGDLSKHLFLTGEQSWESAESRSMIPPLYATSNFQYDSVAGMRAALDDEVHSQLYTRGNNPTVRVLRAKLAALENTEDALIFGSGVAAIAAGVLSQVNAGDHIVCVRNPYSWTSWLLEKWLPRFGVSHTFVDGRDPSNFETASKENTRLYILESPNSFTFDLQDLEAVSSIARSRSITTLADNSYCSPLYQKPADLGIDLVAHSASKYLNGHGDVVAGALCGPKSVMDSVFGNEFQGLGGIVAPHDAWLILRGLRTLELRMERVASTAEKLVEWLLADSRIRQVYYPWHSSHPQFELAQKQMKRGSGQFTVELDTDAPMLTENFCDSLQQFRLAVSWGGFESLVIPAIAKSGSTLPPGTVRFYNGLEDLALLQADLDQALTRAFSR